MAYSLCHLIVKFWNNWKIVICDYLGIVHIPVEEVAACIQYEVSAVEFVSIFIFFNVEKTTDPILPVQIRHLIELPDRIYYFAFAFKSKRDLL